MLKMADFPLRDRFSRCHWLTGLSGTWDRRQLAGRLDEVDMLSMLLRLIAVSLNRSVFEQCASAFAVVVFGTRPRPISFVLVIASSSQLSFTILSLSPTVTLADILFPVCKPSSSVNKMKL